MQVVFSGGNSEVFCSNFPYSKTILRKTNKRRNALDDDDDDNGRFETMRSISIRCRELYIYHTRTGGMSASS